MSTPAPFTTASVADWIDHHAKRSPDAIAIITPDTTLTYGALAKRVEHGAQQLCTCGLAAGDRIAMIVSDELLLLTLLLAAARLATPVLLIPRSTTPAQRSDWMTAAGVKQWISDVMPVGSKHGPLNAIDAKALMATTAGAFKWHPPADDLDTHRSIFVIVAGSGSTGKQKLMPITHAQMQSRARHLCSSLGATSHDRLATMSHLEYVGGVHRLMAALFVGAGFILLDRNRNDWRQWHQRHGLTILSATVFHAQQMLKELRESDCSHPRPLDPIKLSLSSSVVTQELRQAIMSELCSNLRVNYGTNESWSITVALPNDLLRYPGTVGHPLPSVKVNIVDEHLHPLPVGQKGLIATQSDQLILGYLDDEQANQKAFRGGWFIPGDIGYLTDDGQLIFCGRSDNMMIFNGINIYPIEIEQCLLAHPEVADVLAMPTRHAVHQDVPIALVALKKNTQSTEEQLLNYAAAALGPKQPRRIVLTPAIPRNRLGKPIREEVINILALAFSNTAPQPQPSIGTPMKISFMPRPEVDSQTVAGWTRVVSGEDAPRRPQPSEPQPRDPEVRRWLTQVLDLTLALLQAARIPVFDPISVLDCQPHASQAPHWLGVCQHPAPQILPVGSLINLIREAFILADWASEAKLDSASHREEFFMRIQTGAFKVLASDEPRGKSTFEILRVAHRLSIPYRPLAGGVFQLGWGRHARLIHRSTTDHDSAIGLHLTRDKLLTAQMLRQAGLPAPEHHKAPSLAQAQTWAQSIGYPLVVKPSDLERGEGVAVDVTEAGLEAAFQCAQKISPSKSVLIERQVPGVCHRLFITQGQLLYAVKRLPMGVYGDGTSSISELVHAAHTEQMKRPPWMRSGVSSLHPLPLEFLHQQGWSLPDVPSAGQFVALRRIESTAWGGMDEDVTLTVHPDNVSAAIRAAQLLGLEVAGVDLISTDITQAWHSNAAVINEVNYAPLLGGAEISRSHIATYLRRILKNQGKIPIKTIKGGQDAWAQGLVQHQQLIAMGEAAFLTDHQHTLDPQGNTYPMASKNLHERVQGLLMNHEVGALVVVV